MVSSKAASPKSLTSSPPNPSWSSTAFQSGLRNWPARSRTTLQLCFQPNLRQSLIDRRQQDRSLEFCRTLRAATILLLTSWRHSP